MMMMRKRLPLSLGRSNSKSTRPLDSMTMLTQIDHSKSKEVISDSDEEMS